jgi:hypothetical protein
MSWYAHRGPDGSIAVAMSEILPGYSLDPSGEELPVEPIGEDDPELIAARLGTPRKESTLQ